MSFTGGDVFEPPYCSINIGWMAEACMGERRGICRILPPVLALGRKPGVYYRFKIHSVLAGNLMYGKDKQVRRCLPLKI